MTPPPAFRIGCFIGLIRSKIVLLGLLPLVAAWAPSPAPAATWYDWKDDAPDGNWTQGAAGARWWPGDLWDLPLPNNVLKFNNNHYSSSTNNASGYSVNGLVFGDNATAPHVVSGNALQFSKVDGINPFIQNEAGGTLQTIGLDIVGSTEGALEIKMGGDLTFTGAINNNGSWIDIYWDNGKTLALAGAISGSGGLALKDYNIVVLSGDNTYSGGTWLDAGVLRVAHNNALGSTAGNTTVTEGAALQLSNGITTAENLVLRGSGAGDAGALQSVSGANTVTGSITIDAGAPGITRVGAASGASLSIDGDVTASTGKEFWIVGAGSTAVAGKIIAPAPFVKFGGGTATLSGDNELSANKYVREGTVVLSNNNAFGSSGTTELGWLDGTHNEQAAELRIGNGVNHAGKVVAGYISNGLTVTLSAAGASAAEMSGTLDLAHNLTANAGSGAALTISGAVTNGGGIIKTGSGTVSFSGTEANTYTGATVVSDGTLQLGKTAGTQAIAGSVTVNSGAVLLISASNQIVDDSVVTLSGGTILRGSGVSEAMGNLTLTTGSTLDYGAGSIGTLSFGTYTPGSLLTVSNFLDGNVLTFKSDLTSTINTGSLFSFDNAFSYNWNEGSGTFTITAIPESSTVVVAITLAGMLLWPTARCLLRDSNRVLGGCVRRSKVASTGAAARVQPERQIA
ncbi:MAG: autotransporter-associated beta strand repeat-containing protein [Chthoniobacterales bacterium]|nr:autotransporter-associated beta strand repeat-containing protein [Chthoniobacterales bacterium]